jgi:hypothetical protein
MFFAYEPKDDVSCIVRLAPDGPISCFKVPFLLPKHFKYPNTIFFFQIMIETYLKWNYIRDTPTQRVSYFELA